MKIEVIPVGMLQTNCYMVISEGGGALVIDPGAKAEKILAVAGEHGAEIRHILLTHGHFDHTGAANQLRALTGAGIAISGADERMLTHPQEHAPRYVQAGLCEPATADRLLSDGDEITLDELSLRVIETPGHSKGGVTFLLGDVLFAGDTLFKNSVGRTDLDGGDWKELMASVQKLAALPGDYRVLPGHGPATTMEHEREHNPFIRKAHHEAL